MMFCKKLSENRMARNRIIESLKKEPDAIFWFLIFRENGTSSFGNSLPFALMVMQNQKDSPKNIEKNQQKFGVLKT